jgi:hypothetical protein
LAYKTLLSLLRLVTQPANNVLIKLEFVQFVHQVIPLPLMKITRMNVGLLAYLPNMRTIPIHAKLATLYANPARYQQIIVNLANQAIYMIL